MSAAATGSPPACPNGVTLFAKTAPAYTRKEVATERETSSEPSTVRSMRLHAISQQSANPNVAATSAGSAASSVSTIRSAPTRAKSAARIATAAIPPMISPRRWLPSIGRMTPWLTLNV